MSLSQTHLRVVLGKNATAPKRQTPGSAGYDLALAENLIIHPGQTTIGKVEIKVEIPVGWVGLIWPRSSIDFKKHVTTGAGVIDSDYRGLVGVVLHNRGVDTRTFTVGERIAQLVIVPHYMAPVDVVDSLEETEREGGFGSTGTQ